MDNGILRAAVTLIMAVSIIFLVPPYPRPSDSIAKTLLESAASILPFAAFVIIPKLWPLPEDKPRRISMKLSGLALGILFVEHILIWRPDILFPKNPLLGEWLEHGLFILMFVVVVLAFRRHHKDAVADRFAAAGRN